VPFFVVLVTDWYKLFCFRKCKMMDFLSGFEREEHQKKKKRQTLTRRDQNPMQTVPPSGAAEPAPSVTETNDANVKENTGRVKKYGMSESFGAVQAKKYRARTHNHKRRLTEVLKAHGLHTSSLIGKRQGQSIIHYTVLLQNTIRVVKKVLSNDESAARHSGQSPSSQSPAAVSWDSMHRAALMASGAIATLFVRVPDLVVTESNTGMREFCPCGECPGYVGKSLLDFIHDVDTFAVQNAMQEIQQGGPTQFRARLLRTTLADDGMTLQSEYTWQTVKVTHESRDKRKVFLMFELADNHRQQSKGTFIPQSSGTDGMSSTFNCVPALNKPIGAMPEQLSSISRQPTAQDLIKHACDQRLLFKFPGATLPLTPQVPSHLSILTKVKECALGGAPSILGQFDAAAAPAARWQQAMSPQQQQPGLTNNVNDSNILQMLITQNVLKDLQASQGQVSAADVRQQLLKHQQQQLINDINLMEAQQQAARQAAQQQQVQARFQLQAALAMKPQPFTTWPVNAETSWPRGAWLN
jgi:hypothetical protein